jgi:hypothetical protein
VVACAAALVGCPADEVCRQADLPLLRASSVKRGLDRVWTAPGEREAAVNELVEQVDSLRRWLDEHLPKEGRQAPLAEHVATLEQVIAQDLEPDPARAGGVRIAPRVAKDRRISIEDPEMRHGRKSSSRRVDGYKRHLVKNLDDQVVDAVAVTPANRPEAEALVPLNADLERQGRVIGELYIDRAYLSSPVVPEILARGGEVICRPWPQGNGERFSKEDFAVDLEAQTITCPQGHARPLRLGAHVEFEAARCDACPVRDRCTKSSPGRGRAVHIAADEPLQMRLRQAASTPAGRERLRARVPVEHDLAHAVARQGHQARYCGVRKNLYDLRRTCAISNLELAQRAGADAELRAAA